MNPIKRARLELNMTVKDFADELDVDYTTIYKYERGEPREVSIKMMKKLKAFGLDGYQIRKDYEKWIDGEVDD